VNPSWNWTEQRWNLPRRKGAEGWSCKGSCWVGLSRIWAQIKQTVRWQQF